MGKLFTFVLYISSYKCDSLIDCMRSDEICKLDVKHGSFKFTLCLLLCGRFYCMAHYGFYPIYCSICLSVCLLRVNVCS